MQACHNYCVQSEKQSATNVLTGCQRGLKCVLTRSPPLELRSAASSDWSVSFSNVLEQKREQRRANAERWRGIKKLKDIGARDWDVVL